VSRFARHDKALIIKELFGFLAALEMALTSRNTLVMVETHFERSEKSE